MDGAKGMPAARKASGLGSWAFADVPERACTTLRKALKRAIEQITAAHPVIGQHLAQGIENGTICRYRMQGRGVDISTKAFPSPNWRGICRTQY
jgi:hypothetical protein